MPPDPVPSFKTLEQAPAIALTTYRRSGAPVTSPVSVVVLDDHHALFKTYDPSGKVKRLRHTNEVLVAPSTIRGTPTGPAIPATARPISGELAEQARSLLARKHPILHGRLVPLAHRLRGLTTVYYELIPRTPPLANADQESGGHHDNA